MYIIERKLLQSVIIGDPLSEDATILTLLGMRPGRVRIGFGGGDVPIWRLEQCERLHQNLEAHLNALEQQR